MEKIKKILVTGGAGFIGSHTCIELLESGYEVIVIDDLSNSQYESLKRVQKITGKELDFIKADINDRDVLVNIFKNNRIDAVIHFAGFKAVDESVSNPLKYYQNNLGGTLCLLDVMQIFGVKNIVFSSSASVYGEQTVLPIKENASLSVTNPYGRTKLFIEDIPRDLHGSDSNWNISILRYFNPVGAHESGLIGEMPKGISNNIMPYIIQVAAGKQAKLSIFGNDYSTKDGTGVRDYIHVVDLAKGHIKALAKLEEYVGCVIYNLGTGQGYSVLDLINSIARVSKREILYEFVERRVGDVAISYADTTLAELELDWVVEKGLDQMCEDAWRWQECNPNGYDKTLFDNED